MVSTEFKNLKLSAVIPAHNEEESLPKTVAELQRALQAEQIPYELIIVNDNSTDKTAEVIKELENSDPRIRSVDRTPPAGFGRAVRCGLELVEGDMVVIVMADCSDDPRDVVAYYRKIQEGFDCVFGSRFIKGSEVQNYPRLKLFVNRIVNKLIQIMFFCPFNDMSNAFKAFRTEVIRACSPYHACHFNITIEMSLGAFIRRYRIAQIPIRWYGRTWGSSNLSLRTMGRRYLATLIKAFVEKMLISDDLMAERLALDRKDEVDAAKIDGRIDELERRLDGLEQNRGESGDTRIAP
jgi:dolichol-phosphate mannosyltransferase